MCGTFLSVVFLHGTGAVSLQQIHQIVHPGLEHLALVGARHLQPDLHPLEDVGIVVDVGVGPDRVLLAGEGLVGHDAQVAGAEGQGIARDAGGGLVGLAEAAVDDQQLAAALDGAFALLGLHRHMAVDDMAVGTFQAEFLQQHVADGGILVIGIVSVCWNK